MFSKYMPSGSAALLFLATFMAIATSSLVKEGFRFVSAFGSELFQTVVPAFLWEWRCGRY
jgi:hypothetical protein